MKTIALTANQSANLAVKAQAVADLTLEDCRMLARWADCQSAYLWDDMNLQEILNVYRVSYEWDTWEGWAEEDRPASHRAWNSAVIDPGNRMVA